VRYDGNLGYKKGEAYLYIKYGNKNGWYHVNEKSGVIFRK
jgi:hypothetical protein